MFGIRSQNSKTLLTDSSGKSIPAWHLPSGVTTKKILPSHIIVVTANDLRLSLFDVDTVKAEAVNNLQQRLDDGTRLVLIDDSPHHAETDELIEAMKTVGIEIDLVAQAAELDSRYQYKSQDNKTKTIYINSSAANMRTQYSYGGVVPGGYGYNVFLDAILDRYKSAGRSSVLSLFSVDPYITDAATSYGFNIADLQILVAPLAVAFSPAAPAPVPAAPAPAAPAASARPDMSILDSDADAIRIASSALRDVITEVMILPGNAQIQFSNEGIGIDSDFSVNAWCFAMQNRQDNSYYIRVRHHIDGRVEDPYEDDVLVNVSSVERVLNLIKHCLSNCDYSSEQLTNINRIYEEMEAQLLEIYRNVAVHAVAGFGVSVAADPSYHIPPTVTPTMAAAGATATYANPSVSAYHDEDADYALALSLAETASVVTTSSSGVDYSGAASRAAAYGYGTTATQFGSPSAVGFAVSSAPLPTVAAVRYVAPLGNVVDVDRAAEKLIDVVDILLHNKDDITSKGGRIEKHHDDINNTSTFFLETFGEASSINYSRNRGKVTIYNDSGGVADISYMREKFEKLEENARIILSESTAELITKIGDRSQLSKANSSTSMTL